MSRLRNIISTVETNLSTENPNPDSLHMDKGDMERLLDEICDKVAELSAMQQDTQLQDDVEAIIDTAYKTLRNINLSLRKNQNTDMTALLHDKGSPANAESHSSNTSTLTTFETSHTQAQASSSTSAPVEPIYTSNSPNFQPMGVPAVSLPAPTVYSTMGFTSQQYHPASSMPVVSSVHLPNSQPSTLPSITPHFLGIATHTTTSPDLLNPAYILPTNPRSELNTFLQASGLLTQSWYYNATPLTPSNSIGYTQPVRSVQPPVLHPPCPERKLPCQYLVATEEIGQSSRLCGNS
jgi:hypothetical protein